MISLKSVYTLWAYALTVLMVAVYFTNFNLAIFNSDFDLSDEESIQKISNITYDKEIDSYKLEIKECNQNPNESRQNYCRKDDIKEILRYEVKIA